MKTMSSGLAASIGAALLVIVTMTAAAAQVAPTCETPFKPMSAGGASVAPDDGQSLQHKNWQAQNGIVEFTVRSLTAIPADASVYVCFGWKAEGKLPLVPSRPSRLELSGDGKTLKVTTTVPPLGAKPEQTEYVLPLLHVVPVAIVRILAIKDTTVAADAATTIGITHPWVAIIFALATIVIGFWILYVALTWRLEDKGIRSANWLLQIISTPSGYASLSQLQILLWTFVVAASAVYVMSLSGQLIEISSGTLTLLGIAGAAALGAKAHSESQAGSAVGAAKTAEKDAKDADALVKQKESAVTAATAAGSDTAGPAAELEAAKRDAAAKANAAQAAQTKAQAFSAPPPTHPQPKWSDLLVTESFEDDGTTVTRELDVTRFQMLLFTLITAVFVLITVLTTYVIPEISTGFVTLMGISNGVYLGSKVVQRT